MGTAEGSPDQPRALMAHEATTLPKAERVKPVEPLCLPQVVRQLINDKTIVADVSAAAHGAFLGI